MRITPAILATIVLASPAWGAEIDCTASLPQQQMNQCAAAEFAEADAALNAEYKRARAYLKEGDKDLPADLRGAPDDLRDAQRAWIIFRDKACRAEASPFRGGTMEPFLFDTCRARLTRRRTDDLGYIAE